MIYNDGLTSTLYYYVLNAQGDVIALLNADGTLAASYNYGAWGNYSVHGADGKKTTDATFIGHINPIRYRESHALPRLLLRPRNAPLLPPEPVLRLC